ncbi:MAG: glutamine synthetase [Gemmatimonadota bacterium]|nr:MAG: glutamine synthetase [Gemmatimonadota bacterium]
MSTTRESEGRMAGTTLSFDQLRAESESREVRYVQLQFVDILGIPKCVELPVSQLEKAYNNEMMFDGSSIDGFARINESDMALYPDWASRFYEMSPDGSGNVLRVISDVYTDKMGADGARPYEGDPRYNLKQFLNRCRSDLGWDFMTGCEAEFFLFDAEALRSGDLVTHDDGGYFDVDPVDRGVLVRREIVDQLHEMGLEIEALHHEVAQGQHEIDFRYADALETADSLMKFKSLIKSIARDYGLHATFMPKPKAGINGSGMHTHVSAWKDGANIFRDDNAPGHGLSKTAIHFIAGVMKHAGAITAIANPLVNSYKRLVPGYEAPTIIAYSIANRSPMIRLPKATGNSKRLEVRSPDPASNPYLLMAAILAAGVDGVKNEIPAPPPITENVYHQSAEWRAERGIEELPGSLEEALDALEANDVIRGVFSEHTISHYLASKRAEVHEYKKAVHAWELDRYLVQY